MDDGHGVATHHDMAREADASTASAQRRVAIATLDPAQPLIESSIITGVVSIIWPYSSSHHTSAILLADPDFRLRRRRGQVRVQFHADAAQRLASSSIAIGDILHLSLTGATWAQQGISQDVRTPGLSVDGDLAFRRTMKLEIHRDNVLLEAIAIDRQVEPAVPQPLSTPDVRASPMHARETSVESRVFSTPLRISLAANSSPALLIDQQALQASESSSTERIRVSSLWYYDRQSPSPSNVQRQSAVGSPDVQHLRAEWELVDGLPVGGQSCHEPDPINASPEPMSLLNRMWIGPKNGASSLASDRHISSQAEFDSQESTVRAEDSAVKAPSLSMDPFPQTNLADEGNMLSDVTSTSFTECPAEPNAAVALSKTSTAANMTRTEQQHTQAFDLSMNAAHAISITQKPLSELPIWEMETINVMQGDEMQSTMSQKNLLLVKQSPPTLSTSEINSAHAAFGDSTTFTLNELQKHPDMALLTSNHVQNDKLTMEGGISDNSKGADRSSLEESLQDSQLSHVVVPTISRKLAESQTEEQILATPSSGRGKKMAVISDYYLRSSNLEGVVPQALNKWFVSSRRTSSASPAVAMSPIKADAFIERRGYDAMHEGLEPRSSLLAEATSSGFRTNLSYYSPLSTLERYLNIFPQACERGIDVIAMVSSPSTKVERAKSGPKHYHTTLSIVDASSASESVQVQVFRPFKTAVLTADTGDVVLLRSFQVKSRQRKCFLLSGESSAWNVWRFSQDRQSSSNNSEDGAQHQEISSTTEDGSGPPVELGPEEQAHASALRRWWKTRNDKSTTKNS